MKCIIVLGMHRSGTSLISRALNTQIHMGENFAYPKGNKLGTFEEKTIQHINERILNAAGGSWKNPPSEESILQQKDKFMPEMKSVIEWMKIKAAAKGKEFYGWKDPRNSLTIKLWLPLVENVHLNFQFRESDKVATSLEARGDMSYNDAYKLAKEYNERLLTFLNEWISNEYSLHSPGME